MRRPSIALLAALATCLVWVSGIASAQDMSFTAEEADTTAANPAPEEPATGDNAAAAGNGDVIGALAAQNNQQQAETTEAPRVTEASEEVYAVQRVYALRNGRVELAPSFGITVNDQYVTHPSANLGLNYWFTNVLAVGLSFNLYQALESESSLNFHVRRSTRLAVPITEYQLGANLNFTYVPLYGKFAMFNEYIFQWDAYIVGGLGVMRTRPVPIIDPEIRQFDFGWRVAFNVGIGIRVFLTRFLTVFGELRDYAYLEQLENTRVAFGAARQDSSTWTADSPSLTNNVAVQLGFTLFFPFTFDYRLPK